MDTRELGKRLAELNSIIGFAMSSPIKGESQILWQQALDAEKDLKRDLGGEQATIDIRLQATNAEYVLISKVP